MLHTDKAERAFCCPLWARSFITAVGFQGNVGWSVCCVCVFQVCEDHPSFLPGVPEGQTPQRSASLSVRIKGLNQYQQQDQHSGTVLNSTGTKSVSLLTF